MTDEEVAVNLKDHENRIIGIEHRVKDLERFQQDQNKLILSVDRLATNMENMLSEQKDQGSRLKKLEQAPVEQWTSTKKTFFTAITSSIGTAAAGGIIWLFVFITQNM